MMTTRKTTYIHIKKDIEKPRFQVRLSVGVAEWLRKAAHQKDITPATLITKILEQVKEKALLD